MLLDIVLGSKASFRILSVLTKHPGRGFTKEDIKKMTRLGGNSIFRTMNILEKNSIITGNKSGRKTYYRLNLCNKYIPHITGICHMEREDLNNMDSEIATMLREYTRQIADAIEVDSVYVFGSTVKNNYTTNSDVDIALVFKEDIDSNSRLKLKDISRKVETRFKKDIDEHIFKKEDFMKRTIPYSEAVHRDGIRLI
ncbi:MAG: nucleotidyltransferase domain-containing protein [archaeon]